MTFWATFAIINAIWASSGERDLGSALGFFATAYCLWRVYEAEKTASPKSPESP